MSIKGNRKIQREIDILCNPRYSACKSEGCPNEIEYMGRGRPPLYCDECHFEAQRAARRKRYMTKAYGPPDKWPSPKPPVEAMPQTVRVLPDKPLTASQVRMAAVRSTLQGVYERYLARQEALK